jgi:hypothetical protein
MRRVILLQLSNSITKPTLSLYYVYKRREMNRNSIYWRFYVIVRSNITRQNAKGENRVFTANSEYRRSKAVAIKVKTKDKQKERYYKYQNQLAYIIPKDRETCRHRITRQGQFKTSEYASIRFLMWKRKKKSLRNACVSVILKWLYYLYLHYDYSENISLHIRPYYLVDASWLPAILP